MAGDWIKFEVGTFDKPEVVAIADELDLPETHVVGCLLWVWGWFDQQTENGNAPSVTTAFINRRVGVPGFAEAMQNVGWLAVNDDSLTMVGFNAHNGKSAKKRALTARRVAAHKANATVTHQALPREEKRRVKDITSNPDEPDDFEDFWKAYPRRADKKKAKTAWGRLSKAKRDLAIADCKTRYSETEKQFIPLPTTYIHGERWTDDAPGGNTQGLSEYGQGGI